MQDIANRQKFISSLLTSDLQLPTLGKIGAVSNAVQMMLRDIEKQLAAYIASDNEIERQRLHDDMIDFISNMNANPMLSLDFRMKTLRAFRNELELLDEELTVAILDAYKVSINLILHNNNKSDESRLTLGGLCCEAISLGMHVQRWLVMRYCEPGFRMNRQIHELMRLGIMSLDNMNNPIARRYIMNIQHGIAWYELMRTIDFFRLTSDGQQTLYDALEPFVRKMKAMYLAKGETIPKHMGAKYLISVVGDNHGKPEYRTKTPHDDNKDYIVLEMTDLIAALKRQLGEAQRYMEGVRTGSLSPELMQGNTPRTIKLQKMICSTILDGFRRTPHSHQREAVEGQVVWVINDFHRALRLLNPLESLKTNFGDPNESVAHTSSWHVRDISEVGIGLEIREKLNSISEASTLIRLVWTDATSPNPLWAQVRWVRQHKHDGSTHMGLKFLPHPLKHIWIKVDNEKKREPALASLIGNNEYLLWAPTNQVMKTGKQIIMYINNKKYQYQILLSSRKGKNFSVYRVKCI
ncbi:MAG: hypothetical protein R8L53_04690, partial [Mariprofundales bacterium]